MVVGEEFTIKKASVCAMGAFTRLRIPLIKVYGYFISSVTTSWTGSLTVLYCVTNSLIIKVERMA